MSGNNYRKYGILLLTDSDDIPENGYPAEYFNCEDLKDFFNIVFFNSDGKTFISTKDNGGIRFLVIPGFSNPRWFVPCNRDVIRNTGNLIKPTSLKSVLIWKLALILNRFGLIGLLFRNSIYIKSEKLGAKYLKPLSENSSFVIFTNTQGIYQKFTIQEMDGTNKIIAFCKIARTLFASDRIKNEHKAINYLKGFSFSAFKYPYIIDFYSINNFIILKQSPPDQTFAKVITRFSAPHKEFLEEIHEKCVKSINKMVLIDDLTRKKERLSLLGNCPWIRDYIPEIISGIDLLPKYLQNLQNLNLVFSHGDFIPWNCYSNGEKLFVFDWETGDFRPPLWDYFNFIYLTNIFSKGSLLKDVETELKDNNVWALSIIREERLYEFCHLYFLLDMLDLFIHYYFEQERAQFESSNIQFYISRLYFYLTKLISGKIELLNCKNSMQSNS